MNFKQAVAQMVEGNNSDDVVQVIFDEVEPLCKTSTDGNGGETTHLWDWLRETGGYTGKETPQSIASEWDSLSEE